MPIIHHGIYTDVIALTTREVLYLLSKDREKCEQCGHLSLFHTSRTDCQICGVGKCPYNKILME